MLRSSGHLGSSPNTFLWHNSLLLLISGTKTISLCWSLVTCSSTTRHWWIMAYVEAKLHHLWPIRKCWNSCWNVVSDEPQNLCIQIFCVCLHTFEELSLHFQVRVEQWVVEVGAVLLDSCVQKGRDHARDGMREEAALCGHILFDSGPFHKPPNSCRRCRLHVLDCVLAEAACFVSWVCFAHQNHGFKLYIY